MIRTAAELDVARRALGPTDQEFLSDEVARMVGRGWTEDAAIHALQPSLSMRAQLRERIHAFERLQSGDTAFAKLIPPGRRRLIALRIALGVEVAQVAAHLGIDAAEFDRLEQEEYQDLPSADVRAISEFLKGFCAAGDTVALEAVAGVR